MIEHAYIHIPFCLRKCKYCSFISGENIENKGIYMNVLLNEIKSRYRNEKLKTIYIGGGTPSLLDISDIEKLISCFNKDENSEITLEVNPETVTFEKLSGFKNTGINRVSLGCQTFNNKILKYIGRVHTSSQIIASIDIIKKIGYENISIDLIYGLPFQSMKIFKEDLSIANSLDIQHISTYGLKIEEGAYFYNRTLKYLPDDDMQVEMYNFLCDYLSKFNHYEISNFALYGFESRHNCAYWQNKEYYGFGLNASGYQNNIRYKNTSNFQKYIKNPLDKEEVNILTNKEIMENEIILALRLNEGINIDKINKKYNIDFLHKYNEVIRKFIDYGFLDYKQNCIKLTRQGILLSNEILADFLDI